MNLPKKVIHFAWKAAKDMLASKEALRQRHIVVEDGCALCGAPTENILHILWFCAHAKEVWSSSKFSLPFEVGPNWSFLDVMVKLQRSEELRPGLMERFVFVCWGIWKERNVIRTRGRCKLGRITLKNAIGLMDEYQMTNEGPARPATVGPELRKVGLGVLIRDSAGNVITAMSWPLVGPLGALEMEAKAVEIGMRFALDVGIQDAVFESDALEIVNAIQGIVAPCSSILLIVEGIHQLACLFRSCCFSHTKRQGNIPAHILAQFSSSLVSYVAWLETCPSHIEQACFQDISVAPIS
ncbi:uncharacterized protein LOC142628823 [Castanea sativa]|uniref:uncharacterized protein LOC142628823 n=1 Tax=Castanea sativa TaxID=21020 RepID=UPI003F64E971